MFFICKHVRHFDYDNTAHTKLDSAQSGPITTVPACSTSVELNNSVKSTYSPPPKENDL
jgi:hypothetical protein